MSLVEYEALDGIALIRLNDATRRNILSPALCSELIAAVAAAEQDEGVKVIVIAAEPPAFCAGADLDDLKAAAEGNNAAVKDVYASFMAVANSRLPTVAAVEGAAVGAGLNLAMACDMRIADARASFDTRFLRLGLHPGGGHSWMLLRSVGWSTATRLLFAGETLSAQEALRTGLVDILAEGTAREHALTLARSIARTPRELLMRAKASLRLSAVSSHAEALRHETAEQFWSLQQPEFSRLIERMQERLASR